MEQSESRNKSYIIDAYSEFIEFMNRYFVLSKYLMRSDRPVFHKIEILMLVILVLSVAGLLYLHVMPRWLMITLCILMAQRVIEFIVVYSRNFIFGRGRIFTEFKHIQQRGEWLIMMFSINVIQVSLAFSIWYRAISLENNEAFSKILTVLDSFYFSIVTFLTVGYGDIIPYTPLAKALVLVQSALTFYTFVIVINGLISIHFIKR